MALRGVLIVIESTRNRKKKNAFGPFRRQTQIQIKGNNVLFTLKLFLFFLISEKSSVCFRNGNGRSMRQGDHSSKTLTLIHFLFKDFQKCRSVF